MKVTKIVASAIDPIPDDATLDALEDLFLLRTTDTRTADQYNDALIEAYRRGLKAKSATEAERKETM